MLTLVGALSIAEGQTSPCLPADSLSAPLVDMVKDYITSTDPENLALREMLGINDVSVSQVLLLTSGTDCTRAKQAFDAAAGTPNSTRRMYVVKAWSKRFFVRDPNAKAGEWTTTWVFDDKWVVVEVLAGG